MTPIIYTIGHSNHSQEAFLGLLTRQGITAICDVRSQPYSRVHPQFGREQLSRALKATGIGYVFLGKELGGRSADSDSYVDGKIQYEKVARTDAFQAGLTRLIEGTTSHCVAILCAEKDPLVCHRTLLVARELTRRGVGVHHILSDGGTETQEQAEERLLRELGLPAEDMFRSRQDILSEAYKMRSNEAGYRLPEAAPLAHAVGSHKRT